VFGRPPASVTIETDDCLKSHEELKSRGVEFVTEVLEFPWGYAAQFFGLTATDCRYARGASALGEETAAAPALPTPSLPESCAGSRRIALSDGEPHIGDLTGRRYESALERDGAETRRVDQTDAVA
jgi:hypothetical protein